MLDTCAAIPWSVRRAGCQAVAADQVDFGALVAVVIDPAGLDYAASAVPRSESQCTVLTIDVGLRVHRSLRCVCVCHLFIDYQIAETTQAKKNGQRYF